MVAKPTHDGPWAIRPHARDERSMLIPELVVAGVAIIVSLLLSLAR